MGAMTTYTELSSVICSSNAVYNIHDAYKDAQPSTSGSDYGLLNGLDYDSNEKPEFEGSDVGNSDEEDEYYEYYYQMKDEHEEILCTLERQLNELDSEQARREQELCERAEAIIAEAKEERKKEEILKLERQRLKKERIEVARMKSLLAQANKSKRVFCCFVCSRAFLDEETCRQHVASEHLKNNKDFVHKCRYCYMRFKKGHHLRRHEATHRRSKGGYFACNLCPSIFKEEESLAIHKSGIHSVTLDGQEIKKEFVCKCGKEFGLELEFKRHKYYCEHKEDIKKRKKLTKEAIIAASPIVSPAISMSSVVSSPSLGGRPVKDKSCPFCFIVCASMQSRDRHIQRKHQDNVNSIESSHSYIKVDTPDLPFCCIECNKRFSTASSLSIHKRRIHEKKLDHCCKLCDKKYPLPSELRKHMKRVHGSIAESLDIF